MPARLAPGPLSSDDPPLMFARRRGPASARFHTEAPASAVAWHALSPREVLARARSVAAGLTEAEARARLTRHGPNALRRIRSRSAWRILVDQLRSVMVVLLGAAALVALLVGDILDAAAIAAVVGINTALGFILELRAAQAMEALLRLQVPRAFAVRDGAVREIDARDLVPGDVIRIEAGQTVPADARLLSGSELRVDEAPLTGESVPVDKLADRQLELATPLPARSTMLYQGTTAVAGTGHAVVVATGMDTEVGRIGRLMSSFEDGTTPLEHRLDALGRRLAVMALAAAALVALIGAVRGESLAEMIQVGLALAVAAVPEGLPAVATIALALGARRLARRRALVRRLPAMETLGSATLVCTDKTGTLTTGEMTAVVVRFDSREVRAAGVGYDPAGALYEGDGIVSAVEEPVLRAVLRAALLASAGDVRREGERWIAVGDPTDAALVALARKGGVDRSSELAVRPTLGEVPFSSARMWVASFHRDPTNGTGVFVKGAPTRVLALCRTRLAGGGEAPLDDAARTATLRLNEDLAARGLRVLALADGFVGEPHAGAVDALRFLGLVGLADPPSPGVHRTIAALTAAGIRTVMLTGDQRATAQAIAADLGILRPDEEALDAVELQRLAPAELDDRLASVGAFSRVSPEDKLRIVEAYQRRGEIVAMLGDGVNDAAALRRADIGVAMGRRGTDLAREAAGIVLQDDRFETVTAAVEEGRVVFDNLRKFIFYLFSCNVAEVLVLLGAGVTGLPLPLAPVHILWLNLVTDTFPALALAVEPGEPHVMRQPPRDPQAAILSPSMLRAIAFYALLITAVTLVGFVAALARHGTVERARTVAFVVLGLAQTLHLGNARSPHPVMRPERAIRNPWAIVAVTVAIGLQLLALHVDPVVRVLQVVVPPAADWLWIVPLAAIPALVGQVVKARPRRKRHAV